MSLVTPTTKDISDNIIAQLEASLSQSIPLLPKSFMRVLAKALAAVVIILYKYIGFVFLQVFVKTASAVPTEINGTIVTPLTAWGELIGIGAPIAATNAELTIGITVENQGGSLPSGTQLLSASTGVTYLTLGPTPLSAPLVSANIVAAADQAGGGGAGIIGNLGNGAEVTFANPLAGVARAAVVTGTVLTGADAEATDSYRQRVIDRFRRRPQGGAYADYAIWGEEVAGVLNIYPYTGQPGEVDVYVESATEEDGIPTSSQLDEVFNSIERDQNGLASRRPANAFVNVVSIIRTGFDVTVLGLQGDDLGGLQADVTSALEGYFLQAEPYIVGLDVPPRLDKLAKVEILGIINDITKATGGSFTDAYFTISGSTVTLDSYTLGEGEKAKAAVVGFN